MLPNMAKHVIHGTLTGPVDVYIGLSSLDETSILPDVDLGMYISFYLEL
jgi:hypothetical protein